MSTPDKTQKSFSHTPMGSGSSKSFSRDSSHRQIQYSERLKKENEDLKKKTKSQEEEIKSLKDKVAQDVALSIKIGKAESLNNPVSQTRLKEMYDDLRRRWPKIKRHLKSNKETPKSVKDRIQRAFKEGEKKVQKLEKHINDFMDLGKNTDEVSQKVEQHSLSAVQDLQLALYYNRIQDHVLKKYTDVKTEDLMKNLQSECCWLGQLLALNNPPLQPDWENHIPEMDAWHILPRNFRVIKKTNRCGQNSDIC